ncbi:MAG: hypothetical protein CSB24_06490 [Deltaproteobacteria bacterium]|nr:MAG: hypothetical protein CSB24_06490 [Deltaproteobacteria bacterium]
MTSRLPAFSDIRRLPPMFLRIILIVIFFFLPAAFGTASSEPPRNLTILGGDAASNLQWKLLWDQAKKDAASRRFSEAAAKYKQLLAIKPDIEAARFEYAGLLHLLGRDEEAVMILERLTAVSPDNLEYYLPLAAGLERLGHFAKAEVCYEKAYQLDLPGKHTSKILPGLVNCLEKQGKIEKMLPFLQQLVSRNPEDASSLQQLAHYLYTSGRKEQAARRYLELFNRFKPGGEVLLEMEKVLDGYPRELAGIRAEYLREHPDHARMRRELGNFYLEDEQFVEALAQYEILEQQGGAIEPETLLQLGDLCLGMLSRPDKALHYYDNYLSYKGNNQQIREKMKVARTALAGGFAAIAQKEGGESLWQDLHYLAHDRKPIFLLIAENLAGRGDNQISLELLETAYRHEPDEQNLLLICGRLAKMGRHEKSLQLLESARPETRKSKDYLKILLTVLGRIKDGERVFRIAGEHLESGIRSPELAAIVFTNYLKLKEFEKAEEFFGLLGSDGVWRDVGLENYAAFIDYLQQKGDFKRADRLADELLQVFARDAEKKSVLKGLKSKILWQKGHIFLAEQAYRSQIIQDPELLGPYLNIIDFLLKNGRLAEADRWFEVVASSAEAAPYQQLMIEREIAAGNYRPALALTRKLLNAHDTAKFRMILAEIYFLQGSHGKCVQEISSILKKEPHNIDAIVIADYLINRKFADYEKLAGNLPFKQAAGLAAVFDVYSRLGLHQVLIEKFEQEAAKTDSPYLLFQAARSYEKLSRYDEAARLYQKLQTIYADEPFWQKKIIEMDFRVGRFEQVLVKINNFWEKNQKDKEFYFDLSILEARTLWAMDHWQAGLAKYEGMLILPAAKRFMEQFRRQIPPDDFKEYLELEPELLVRNAGRKELAAANLFYADYRRQELVAKELSARKAIADRDYFYAEMQLEEILREPNINTNEVQMLDLADIYNRLGKHGQEAELYAHLGQNLQKTEPITGRMKKIRKQFRPSTDLLYRHFSADGRAGRKNIVMNGLGLHGRLPSFIGHVFELDYNYQLYSDHLDGEELDVYQMSAQYTVNFLDDYLIQAGLGSINRGAGQNTLLYNLKLEGQLDSYLRAYAGLSQQMVSDSLNAVNGNLSKRDYEAGFTVDSIPRIVIGGYGKYRQFSDDNSQQLVDLYTSYNYFGEKTHLRLKYSFDAVRSQTEADEEEKLPYWAPGSYWHHKVSFYADFLLSGNRSFGGAPGHISLEYGIGYEDNISLTHSGQVNIFLEMTDDILLKGNLSVFDSENLNSHEGFLSLVYRW